MRKRLSLLPLLGLLTLGYAAKCPKQRTSPGREILCYTSTNDVGTLEDSICRCTTLVHQGHDIQDLATSGIKELQKSLKESNPVLQFVLSINDNGETLKTSANVRLEAVARIARILNEVDGVELNVTAGTKERLVHFVQGLRNEMVRKSKDKRIIMVLPTKPQDLAKHFDLKALSKYVDLFTIPTHYLIDEEEEAFRTFHPSRLMGLFDMLNTDNLIDLVIGLGASKRKILVSMPASGYKFTLENKEENTPRAPTRTKQPIPISRSELCEAIEKGEWILERDEDLTAPYAFKDDTWIAFEDKISAGIKGRYVLLRDLAGLGIHNVEQDSKTKCEKSLTEEVYHSFTDNKRKTREAVLTSLQEELQPKPQVSQNHIKSSEFRIVRVVDIDGHVHANRENLQTEFSCPRQGYFVHPKSCNRFYRCVKFNQEVEDYSVFEFDCPAGLAFDERTEVCVWPGSITEGSACPGSSEIAPSKGPKFTCPDHPGYYADPNNCRFFYACYNLGEHELSAYEFRCPYGLVFDEEKLICEWPYLVPKCGGSTYHRHEYGGGGHSSHDSGHGGFDGSHAHGGYDESSHGHGGYDDHSHDGSIGGHGNGHGHTGQGESSGGGYDGSSHGYDGHGSHGHGGTIGEHGNGGGHATGDSGHDDSSGGGYDGSSHGYDGHGSHGNGGTIGVHGNGGGHATGDSGHGDSSGGGYDGSSHGYDGHSSDGHGGTIGEHGNDDRHATGHSGHDDSSGGGYDGSSHGYDGHGSHGHGGGHGNDDGHATGHSGHDDSSGGGYDGSSHGYDGHSSHGDGGTIGGHGNDDGHATGHSGHGGNDGYADTSGGGYGGSSHGYDGHSDHGHGGTTVQHEHDFKPTTVHPGHGGSGGYDGSSHGEHGGSSGGHYDEHEHGTDDSGHGSYGGDGHTTVHSGYDGHGHSEFDANHGHGESSDGEYHGEHTTPLPHSGNGHTTQSDHDAGGFTIVHPDFEEIGHTLGHSGNAEYTTYNKGVHTGITSGSYDGYTPVIQYGGQTGSGVTYGSGRFGTVKGSGSSGSVGSTIYHGNDYSRGSGESTYSKNGAAVSTGINQGSYDGHSSFGGSIGTSHPGNTYYPKNPTTSVSYGGGISPGSITSGSASQGVIGTGDATSGTVYTHGDGSGTVITGPSGHGNVISGVTKPGYMYTQSGTPGYVVTNGVQTSYNHYGSKNTFDHGFGGNGVIVTGPQAPGVVLTGHSSPGTYLVGHTTPGGVIGGAVRPGTTISDSTGVHYNTGRPELSIYSGTVGPSVVPSQGHFGGGSKTPVYQNNPFLIPKEDTGYKTNEYHDNGGRGTIRYNNGEVTHKYTEDDVRNHHMQFGTLPKFDTSSYRTDYGDFTKTGPTKTGITTAQVGGSASYVAATGKPKPFSGTQNIGANAFSSSSDHSDTSSKTSSEVSFGTSTSSPNVRYQSTRPELDSSRIDVSKINLGSTRSGSGESGYSYTKPSIQLNTFGASSTTKAPFSQNKQNTFGQPTTAAPFLDVHIYNNPSVVTAPPVTPAPGTVNTYSYGRPSTSNNYQETMYQAAKMPSPSVGNLPAGIYSKPKVDISQKTYPSVSSTISPVAFTTGPLENFKTTVFEAAKIPISVSTVHPVIDTGYKTVVSSTQYPINTYTNNFGSSENQGYKTNTLSTKGNSALDINVSFQPHLPTQEQYETITPAVEIESPEYNTSKRPLVTQSVKTYDRPATVLQNKYGSTTFSDYSEMNNYSDSTYQQTSGKFEHKVPHDFVTPSTIYQSPTMTPLSEIYHVPSSTIAPAIGVTYRQPFQVVTSRPTARVTSGGYNYSKPSVKFVSTTSPSITYENPIEGEYGSQKGSTGGSPTNVDISKTEVKKLITNYDRGNTKYTPSGYETYQDDKREDTTFNAGGYTGQQSYSRNSGQSYASGKMTTGLKSQSGDYGRVYSTTPSYERVETSDYKNYGVTSGNYDTSAKVGTIPSTTYRPISKSSIGFSTKAPLSRRPSPYGPTTPVVTTYSAGYNKGFSTTSYEAGTSKNLGKQNGHGKVIVKFSDLHPLLLGKLGAECTCKADPFATFRSGKPLPINSSKGRIDLNNYDESDVYVDLESSKENGDYDSSDYVTNVKDSSQSDYDDDGKYETPAISVFDGTTPAPKGAAIKSKTPLSTHVSVSSSTYLPPVSYTKGSVSSTYLPASSTSLTGNTRTSYSNNDVSVSAAFTSHRGSFRAGKTLSGFGGSSSNSLTGQTSNPDYFGSSGVQGLDETLQGTGNCARPGLFRHPNFCNKFYACHWDEWKKTFTLHIFNCPVHLTFDSGVSACNWPSKGPACQDDNLLV